MNLTEQRVLITGGTSGIGLEIAKALSQMGNRVIVCGSNQARVEKVRDSEPAIDAVHCDITRETDLTQLMAHIDEKYEGLDLLINNAGVQHNYDFADPDVALSQIDNEIGVNLTGLIKLTKLALPMLLKSDSAGIVNVASGTGWTPKPDGLVYSATKAAVFSFSDGLRWTLRDSRIHVYTLVPPVVETSMTAGRSGDKVSPDVVVDALLKGLERPGGEILVGKMGLFKRIHRISPRLAAKIIRKQP